MKNDDVAWKIMIFHEKSWFFIRIHEKSWNSENSRFFSETNLRIGRHHLLCRYPQESAREEGDSWMGILSGFRPFRSEAIRLQTFLVWSRAASDPFGLKSRSGFTLFVFFLFLAPWLGTRKTKKRWKGWGQAGLAIFFFYGSGPWALGWSSETGTSKLQG